MRIESGTRALVTGASRGIGRALAEALARRGATLGLMARSRDELEALAAVLPGEHHVLVADAADADAVRAAVDGFAAAAGGLDLLVANAGLTHYAPFAQQPLADALLRRLRSEERRVGKECSRPGVDLGGRRIIK